MEARIRLLAGILATTAAGCAPAPSSGVVSGTVTYRERIALPPDSRVHVLLQEVDPPAGSSPIVADTAFVSPGQVPSRSA